MTQSVFPLGDIRVLTDTIVRRVVFDEAETAVGKELANGHRMDLKEVGQAIVSAGAYLTPQFSMLSGIGDPSQLSYTTFQSCPTYHTWVRIFVTI